MPSASASPYIARFLRPHASEDERHWTALLHHADSTSPFASLAYIRAIEELDRVSVRFVAVFQNDRICAGAPLFERTGGPLQRLVIPPFTPYTPVLIACGNTDADVHARRSALDTLLAFLETKYHVLQFELSPNMLDVRTFIWRSWHARPRYSYRLRLDEPADLLSLWSAGARRTFRKAHDQFRFQEASGEADAIVTLCADSYARHHRPFPGNRANLNEMIRHLMQQGMVRSFSVTPLDASSPEAGVLVLCHAHTAYYWIAGGRPGPAMTVLLGHLLPKLRDDGCTAFDFVGANTPSIAEFKRRFGPSLLPYYRVTRCTLPLLRRILGEF